MVFSSLKKYTRKYRKPIKKAAKTYLKYRRSPLTKQFMKGGVPSTTAVAKALANLKARVNTVAEYKLLDHAHTTGSPDVTLRQFWPLSASANQATVGDTTTPGTRGYLLIPVNMPTRGDGSANFDGNRYHVSSLQWKGTLYSSTVQDTVVRLMVVAYEDEDMDAFNMTEFMIPDNNGEYSTASKRNFDYKNYKIVASRNFKISAGAAVRKDFNILARPNRVVRHFQTDDAIKTVRYFCVAFCSSDVAAQTSIVNYQGNTRMRFIA